MDSRAYYGGYDNPSTNAVLNFWLCDDKASVASFRNAQKLLITNHTELGVDLDHSFTAFSRAITLYDRRRGIPFDLDRTWSDS